jgi:hypothetical protein
LVIGDVVRLANLGDVGVNEVPEFSAEVTSMTVREVIA